MITQYIRTKLEQEYHNINLWYFVSFLFGLLFFFHYNLTLLVAPFCILAVILAISIFYFKSRDSIILFFISWCALLFLFGWYISSARTQSIDIQTIKQPILAEILGNIEHIRPTLSGYQVTLNHIGPNKKNLHKVRVNIANKLAIDLKQGDRIQLKTKLFPLPSSVLPDSFDFGFYMYMQQIEATGYALTKPKILSRKNNIINHYIQNIRSLVYHRLINVMGDTNGNFAAAILIGETKAIPKKVANNMRETGVSHILSVSGLHLSLVAMIFFIVSRIILNVFNCIAYNANIKLIAALISLGGSFAYLQISGSNIAATRAFIMTGVFLVAIILGRYPHPLRSVVIAAFAILIFLPEYILHPSFQLSFAAVLCLISGYELYIKNTHLIGKSKGVFFSMRMYILTNIYSSFLASIVTAPYVIYHFYKFANYSILMNLIAVPLMSFLMMPLSLLALLLMPINMDKTILQILSAVIEIVINSAEWLVTMPRAVWYVGHISSISLVLFTFGFFWLCFWQTAWRFAGIIIIFISTLVMLYTPKPDFIYDHRLKIVGLKNQKGQIELYSQTKLSKFITDYWSSWYGQKDIVIHYHQLEQTDLTFPIYDNKKISLNYFNCTNVDFMILTSEFIHCNNQSFIVDYADLVKFNQVLIFCGRSSQCISKFIKKQTRW